MAIALLSKLGYRVVASTGRLQEADALKALGAAEVIDRAELSAPGKPLAKERWAGVVDAVGSHTLANACAGTKYGGAVAACGLAQGMDFPASVAPFILRGITLYGIDSVMAPLAKREQAWAAAGARTWTWPSSKRWCARSRWPTPSARAPTSWPGDPRAGGGERECLSADCQQIALAGMRHRARALQPRRCAPATCCSCRARSRSLPDGSSLAQADLETQTRQCLANLRAVLEAGGATLQQVAKVTVYMSEPEGWPVFNRLYAEFFGAHKPARAIVPVSAFPGGFKVEIDAIAVLSA